MHHAGCLTLLELKWELNRQVEIMHLHFYGYMDVAVLNSNTTACIGNNIQLCSATLTELYLDGLDLGHCFYELNDHAVSACCSLKVRHSCRLQLLASHWGPQVSWA